MEEDFQVLSLFVCLFFSCSVFFLCVFVVVFMFRCFFVWFVGCGILVEIMCLLCFVMKALYM